MVTTTIPERYPIGRTLRLRWWVFFACFGVLWAMLLLAGAIRGYEPPVGWSGAVAGMPLVALPWGFLFWLVRIFNDQHIILRPDGLLVVVPFPRLMPFDDIACAKRVNYREPLGEYWLNTFVHRKLIPAWNEAPNVEVQFRRAVRLNLYPFRWFRLLQLTLDRPNEFLAALSSDVRVEIPPGSEWWPSGVRAESRAERVIFIVVIIIIALGFGYWIVFGG